jgi:enterochelin esterase family protein
VFVKSSLASSALARLAVTFGLASSSLLSACASSDPATETPQGGSGPSGGGQPTAGSTLVPTGGTVAQAAGTDAGGTTTAGTDAGGTNAGGTGGAAGSASGGSAGSAAGGPPGLPEVGAEGDGDFIVGPTYTNEKELSDQGNPKGKSFSFSMPLASSKLFDGKDPTVTKPVNTNRSINVYVPAKYQDGTPAALLVIQDGPGELTQVSRALDNLTVETDPMRKLPPFIAVAVQNGGDDSIGSERGLEYDTVSDKYARFIDTEVLPAVIADAKIKAAYPGLKFTTDPSGRATMGCSSGGAAAFTMAWLRPDLFSRVVAYSATLVAQQNPKAPESAMYPDGAWEYHSGKELIKNDTEGREKKLRIFINAQENDNGSTAAESGKHNWLMANQRTAADLKAKGFHYKYIEGKGQGHCSGTVKSATMATVLMWLWRGYVPSGN